MEATNLVKASAPATLAEHVPAQVENDKPREIEVPNHEAPQWSDGRAEILADEMRLIAAHFAEHEFLLPSDVLDMSPSEENRRNPSASIIVNAGTQPNQVVYSALAWVEKNPQPGPLPDMVYTWTPHSRDPQPPAEPPLTPPAGRSLHPHLPTPCARRPRLEVYA